MKSYSSYCGKKRSFSVLTVFARIFSKNRSELSVKHILCDFLSYDPDFQSRGNEQNIDYWWCLTQANCNVVNRLQTARILAVLLPDLLLHLIEIF